MRDSGARGHVGAHVKGNASAFQCLQHETGIEQYRGEEHHVSHAPSEPPLLDGIIYDGPNELSPTIRNRVRPHHLSRTQGGFPLPRLDIEDV